jgi:hypothetical protein
MIRPAIGLAHLLLDGLNRYACGNYSLIEGAENIRDKWENI